MVRESSIETPRKWLFQSTPPQREEEEEEEEEEGKKWEEERGKKMFEEECQCRITKALLKVLEKTREQEEEENAGGRMEVRL
jgi:hypothetical protein